MADELSEFAAASPQRRRIIRSANSAKAAQAAGFRRIGYNPNPLSNMPRGGQLSPGQGESDLGVLSQREAAKLAKWKQRPGKPVAASKEFGRKVKRGPDSARVCTDR